MGRVYFLNNCMQSRIIYVSYFKKLEAPYRKKYRPSLYSESLVFESVTMVIGKFVTVCKKEFIVSISLHRFHIDTKEKIKAGLTIEKDDVTYDTSANIFLNLKLEQRPQLDSLITHIYV